MKKRWDWMTVVTLLLVALALALTLTSPPPSSTTMPSPSILAPAAESAAVRAQVSASPMPSATSSATARVEPAILVTLPVLTGGLFFVTLAGMVLFAILLFMFLNTVKVKNAAEKNVEQEESSQSKDPETLSLEKIKRMTAEQVERTLRGIKADMQARVMTQGEDTFALIALDSGKKLKLEVEKTHEGYVLKEKAPQMTLARVMYQKEGLETDKLVLTEKRSGIVIAYDPDSIWAYVDLEYRSLTEDGINDDRLKRFFNFDHIPPSPTAFDVLVVKKARMERRGADFYLAEKGEVTVTEK